MDQHIDARVVSAELDRIIDRAVTGNMRFVVERDGRPAVVIMSLDDYRRNHSPPKYGVLEAMWADATARGLDKMTTQEIDAEIAPYRAEKAEAAIRR